MITLRFILLRNLHLYAVPKFCVYLNLTAAKKLHHYRNHLAVRSDLIRTKVDCVQVCLSTQWYSYMLRDRSRQMFSIGWVTLGVRSLEEYLRYMYIISCDLFVLNYPMKKKYRFISQVIYKSHYRNCPLHSTNILAPSSLE
jgi:hypothetical protein